LSLQSPVMQSRIVCPVCRLGLDRQSDAWRCPQGHSFDVAREGYVNLLLVQQKSSTDPGDSPDMVIARREFLQAGHYQPLRQAVLDVLSTTAVRAPAHGAQHTALLDIGCGEGYYTSAFGTIADEVVGLDIAKPAIRLAAKRFSGITWLVGTGAQLPIADASVNWVSCLFTQLHIDEIHRVLVPHGHVLVVTPAPEHLWTVREGLFEEVHAHEPDKFLAGFESRFTLAARREIRFELQLIRQSLGQLLLMTPYVWKARPERRAALEQHPSFTTEAAFTLLLFEKN